MQVTFKNVGQGDSILLEWEKEGKTHYGIIDCNIYDAKNPVLEEIIKKKVSYIDFIILSHFHFDHYSGLGELLEYLTDNKITVGIFIHTLTSMFLEIFELQENSRRVIRNTENFALNFEKANKEEILLEIDAASNKYTPIHLYDEVYLSFLAPTNQDEILLSKQKIRYSKKLSTTFPDVNFVSTVILISNKDEGILLTSDAKKHSFVRIFRKMATDKMKLHVKLIQVPHHGSLYNLEEKFWNYIKKDDKCPAIFSVGDSKKDKLPNKEVVEFFDTIGCHNISTNYVYGISDFYPGTTITDNKNPLGYNLPIFATKIKTIPKAIPHSRFQGDQILNVDF
jgi:beta-lactamase superfamily II metal-dependent hydrolase